MFRSPKSTQAIVILLALASLVSFQNCDPVDELKSATSLNASGNGSGGGGQPYDGKPFVVRGVCGDGTLVRSRLVSVGGAYLLYRDECQTTTAPKVIPASEVSESIETVRYQGRTFIAEKPAIPLPGVVSWFIQLQGPLVQRSPSLFIVDLFETDALEISRMKAQGHTVICRISGGTAEQWNPDFSSFPQTSLGRSISSGGQERWIDIRQQGVKNVMLARLDESVRRGCHGVDFDSVDGYLNSTGFPLSREEQMSYNQFLAFGAHDRDLIMSLNNVPELAPLMSTVFDFAVAEECFAYGECAAYSSFIRANKPVLAIEYGSVSAQECDAARSGLFSLAYFNRALDGTRYETCQ